jgi:hypothetical protein
MNKGAGHSKKAIATAPPDNRRKPLPAWNEVEIDEQRENAGRPDPAFLTEEGYADDDLAEELGEEFVLTATSGEQAAEDLRYQDVPEEVGGPFVETSGRIEFARGEDQSNPQDAEPAAFPTALSADEPVSPEDEIDEANEEDGDANSGALQPGGRNQLSSRARTVSMRSGAGFFSDRKK